jgi:cytochrome c556
MKRLIVVAGLMGFGVVAAFAQGNVIEERQNMMKQNSADVRATTPMIRGQAPFDLVKVQSVLKEFSDHGKRLPALFPPGSDKGDTKALPVLFEKKADFDAASAKFSKDSDEALVAIKDEASFKTAFPKVLENCGSCHNAFRKS